MMIETKLKLVAFHSIPLIGGIILSYFLWQSNAILLMTYILAVFLVIFTGEERRMEFLVFIYGAFVGAVIEIIGTQVSGYQSFTNPDVFGIPYWLIAAWGYGFVLMKRIGLIIGVGSPWVRGR